MVHDPLSLVVNDAGSTSEKPMSGCTLAVAMAVVHERMLYAGIAEIGPPPVTWL